jgi:hypothetical protein
LTATGVEESGVAFADCPADERPHPAARGKVRVTARARREGRVVEDRGRDRMGVASSKSL